MAVETGSTVRGVVRTRPHRGKARSPWEPVAYVLLVAIGVFFLAPFVWMVFASLDADATLQVALPNPLTLGNFVTVLTSGTDTASIGVGLYLGIGTALVTGVCATLAAYPLSRIKLRFGPAFIYGSLFASSLPVVAILVPAFTIFSVVPFFTNALWATTLFLAASLLPFDIWMMKNFIDGVPMDMEEAAAVDGASSLQTLWHVILPLLGPGLATVIIFSFTSAWGNFYVPFILLSSATNTPPAVQIFTFFAGHGAVSYGPLAAFSVIYALPSLILYLLTSRFLGSGFALGGAVKG
ncbi:MAG: carbohydrate ABC transporter permease [Candidatus Dormibacteraceae bacterium]